MHRGQATILLLAIVVPVSGIALLGLALLGARVQGERAQRLADVAALELALGRQPVVPSGVELEVASFGGATRVTVRLPHTRLELGEVGPSVFTAEATALARPITTADGHPGAVLIG